MRTVLDVTVCAHSAGGVGRWIKGLSGGLAELSQLHLSIDLPETHPGVPCTVREAVPVPSPEWMALPLVRRHLIRKGRLESTRAERIARIAGMPDIIHLSGVQPLGEGRVKVVTFFDDTPWTEAENHTETTLMYAGRLMDLIAGGAAVMAISRWARERAIELFHLPEERAGAVCGAADSGFTPGEPDPLVMESLGLEPGGYFLHVGSFVPRKNIPFLLDCFRKAGDTGRTLVLAGAESWGDPLGETGGRVKVLRSISDNLLLSLYRGAEALLLPSTSEGLGLPALEAIACGTPVISSGGGALGETVSGRGLVLPVNDADAWIDAIRNGATDDLREMAARASVNSWTDAAGEAMEFYRRLL